jgi:hypothetical protein
LNFRQATRPGDPAESGSASGPMLPRPACPASCRNRRSACRRVRSGSTCGRVTGFRCREPIVPLPPIFLRLVTVTPRAAVTPHVPKGLHRLGEACAVKQCRRLVPLTCALVAPALEAEFPSTSSRRPSQHAKCQWQGQLNDTGAWNWCVCCCFAWNAAQASSSHDLMMTWSGNSDAYFARQTPLRPRLTLSTIISCTFFIATIVLGRI